jgi:hypothetical protein
MTFPLEYHKGVQRSSSASFPLSGMLVLPLVLLFIVVLSVSPLSSAQVNGTPPSVTSTGFGGRAVNGTPPSVTSLGRGGFAPHGFAPSNADRNFHSQFSRNGDRLHHRTMNGDAYYPYVYALPVPYSLDMDNSDQPDQEDDDSNYQGGPTVFDRRGSGRDSYIPPTYPGPAHPHAAADSTQAQTSSAPPNDPPPAAAPDPPQPSTILVFKDGHQVEVGNYAIVGQTLYDLTPGRPRKIALADLDLSVTQKQNDDRGIAFQLPPSAQAN